MFSSTLMTFLLFQIALLVCKLIFVNVVVLIMQNPHKFAEPLI